MFWQVALGEGGDQALLFGLELLATPVYAICRCVRRRLFAALGDRLPPGGREAHTGEEPPELLADNGGADIERAKGVAGQFPHRAGIAVVAHAFVRRRTESASTAGADDDATELVRASLRLTLWSPILPGFDLHHALPEVVGPRRLVTPLDEITRRGLNRAMATPWRELAWKPHASDRGDGVLGQEPLSIAWRD